MSKLSHNELANAIGGLIQGEFPSAWEWIGNRLNEWIRWRVGRFPEKHLDIDSYNVGFCDGIAVAASEPDKAKEYGDALRYARQPLEDQR